MEKVKKEAFITVYLIGKFSIFRSSNYIYFSVILPIKLVDDKISGMSLWGWAVAVSGIVIALICPFLALVRQKVIFQNILKMTTVMVVILCFSLLCR